MSDETFPITFNFILMSRKYVTKISITIICFMFHIDVEYFLCVAFLGQNRFNVYKQIYYKFSFKMWVVICLTKYFLCVSCLCVIFYMHEKIMYLSYLN